MDRLDEIKASKLILEMGVSVPIGTPSFLRRRGRVWKVTMRAPGYGGMMRISKKYLEMGVTYEEIKENTLEENMKLYSEKGKLMSEMIAYSLVRGYLSGKFLNKAVAWWLRWCVHPIFIQEAWFQLISLVSTVDFQSIIRSAEMINVMKPILSHD